MLGKNILDEEDIKCKGFEVRIYFVILRKSKQFNMIGRGEYGCKWVEYILYKGLCVFLKILVYVFFYDMERFLVKQCYNLRMFQGLFWLSC